MSGLTYYCWRCYAESTQSHGACASCGERIEAPAETGYTEQLVWALKHPVRERRLLAAHLLGSRHDPRALGSLREAALEDDPYVAAAALISLMERAFTTPWPAPPQTERGEDERGQASAATGDQQPVRATAKTAQTPFPIARGTETAG